uniref:PPPDE domain-containing protein n=1 Tax=Acrobeloides nanus TaxID=290746 RepID=A0A914E4U1_9BILA
MGFPVKLYVYELSRGLASKISAPLLGRQIDGIWHTGITVYGKEYYFGHFGIANVPVGSFFLGNPTEIVELGETEITEKEFQEHVNELVKTTFAGQKYQLLKHNCNTFSNEAAKFLTGNSIPEKITNLPNDVLSTKFGQMIHPHIDSIVTQFRQAIAIRDDKSFHSQVISLVSSVSKTIISNPQSLAQAQNPDDMPHDTTSSKLYVHDLD